MDQQHQLGTWPPTGPPHLQERVGGPRSTSRAPPEGLGLAPCRPPAALVPLGPNQLPSLLPFLRTRQRCVQLVFTGASDHTISPAHSWQTHLVPSVTIISPWASTEKYSVTFYLILQTTTNRSRSLLSICMPFGLYQSPPNSPNSSLHCPPSSSFSGFPEQTGHNSAQTMRRPVTPSLASQAPPSPARPLQGEAKGLGSAAGPVIPALCDLGKTPQSL